MVMFTAEIVGKWPLLYTNPEWNGGRLARWIPPAVAPELT